MSNYDYESVREILDAENRFCEETLDHMEYLDHRETFRGWDMGDLIAHAALLDVDYRRKARQERRQQAARRLCRIIAVKYSIAVAFGDCNEAERLADALALATKAWCYG